MKDYVMTVWFALAASVGLAVGCGEAEQYVPGDADADSELTASGTPMCTPENGYTKPNLVSRCQSWPLQAICIWVNPGVTSYQVVGCKTAYCNGTFCSYVTCVSGCP